MNKPVTIRIPEDLLTEIDRFVQESQLDRSTYLREILKKGFTLGKEDRLFQKYALGEMSMMEVCEELSLNPWEFSNKLREKHLHLNVDLEDWLDSAELAQ